MALSRAIPIIWSGMGIATLHPSYLALSWRELQNTGNQHQLAVRVAPLAQPEVVEEILSAPAAQRAGTQGLALLLEAAPEVDQRGEVGIHVLPLRMGLVGGLLAVRRALAHILHRQRAGDNQDFLKAALLGPFQHHTA